MLSNSPGPWNSAKLTATWDEKKGEGVNILIS